MLLEETRTELHCLAKLDDSIRPARPIAHAASFAIQILPIALTIPLAQTKESFE
jgi:hypothetical protein